MDRVFCLSRLLLAVSLSQLNACTDVLLPGDGVQASTFDHGHELETGTLSASTCTSGADGQSVGSSSESESGANSSTDSETDMGELGVEVAESEENEGDEDGGEIEDCLQAGGAWCGGACIDPDSNANYCGAFGRCEAEQRGQSCHSSAACEAGICVLKACPSEAELECDGECFNPSTSAEHCGAEQNCTGNSAGQICESSLSCVAGNCTGLDIYGPVELFTAVPGRRHPWLLSATSDPNGRLAVFWHILGQVWLARQGEDGGVASKAVFKLDLEDARIGPARAVTLRDGTPGILFVLDDHAWWWQASTGDSHPPQRITPQSPHTRGWYGFWSHAPSGELCTSWKVPELAIELFTRCFDGVQWSDIETITLPAPTGFLTNSRHLWGADGSDYWSLVNLNSEKPEYSWVMALRRSREQSSWAKLPLPEALLSHGAGNYHLVARNRQLAVIWVDNSIAPRKLSISHWRSGSWSEAATITTGVDLTLRASAHNAKRRSALLLHDEAGGRLAFGDAFENVGRRENLWAKIVRN